MVDAEHLKRAIVDAAVDTETVIRGVEEWWWPRLEDGKLDVEIQDPDGTVTTRIMYVGGKAAYLGLKRTPDFVPVAGVKNSIYQAKTGAMSVLSGKNLVTVQGVFITPPPVSTVDVRAQLIPLVKLASKRA